MTAEATEHSTSIVYRGPQPYTELDKDRFFGRDREIEELCDLVERNRLSIVTAPSGVGKTSVLLAGVVPRLRQRHEQELLRQIELETLPGDENDPLPSAISLGPTIVCRNWSGNTRRPAHRILLDAVVEGVRELQDPKRTVFLTPNEGEHPEVQARLEEEASDLLKILTESSAASAESLDWLELMSDCADVVGRVILLFDQFEDALRLPVDGGRKVLQTISMLFRQESRARVLLSFRQEFVMNLHDLEVSIGGMQKRTYYLQSMTKSAINEIVMSPATRADIKVDPEVVNTIRSWLETPSKDEDEDENLDELDAREASDDTEAVPLLTLQALLVDIYEFMTATTDGRFINEGTLRAYRKAKKVDQKELADKALQNHIDKMLARSTTKETSIELDDLATEATTEEKNLILRRLFSRMPSHLTSGSTPGAPGYKNQVRLGKLVQEILRNDLEVLNYDLDATQFDDLLNTIRNPKKYKVDLKEFAKREAEQNVLSGVARRGDWNNLRAANVLVVGFAELLRRLADGNILKPLGSAGEQAYELVHDGLGPAVQSWADQFQAGRDDVLSSLTRLSGMRFRWTSESTLAPDMVIDNASWSGCVVSDQTMINVVFRNCDLRGTMFIRCSFTGGAFENCILDGSMFIKNRFLPQKGEPTPFHFRGGRMTSALFQGCTFDRVLIDDVVLDGTVFLNNIVFGQVFIEHSSMEVVVFRGCTHRPEGNRERDKGFFVSNCDLIHSRIVSGNGKAEIAVYLDGETNQLYPNDLGLLTGDPEHTRSRAGG